MPSVPLPNNSENDRSAVPSEFEQPGDGTEGTVDRLEEAVHRFVELGDDGVFMTCRSDGCAGEYSVHLRCKDLRHAQAVHRALIEIVAASRQS